MIFDIELSHMIYFLKSLTYFFYAGFPLHYLVTAIAISNGEIIHTLILAIKIIFRSKGDLKIHDPFHNLG